MNILSLFDGCSCGQQALNNLKIPYTNYFSSEIDKWAIAVTQHNYPMTIQLGDVRNFSVYLSPNHDHPKLQNAVDVDGETEYLLLNVPKIDLLIAGSPCQGFSKAGHQLNFNDPRSALFFEFVRILKECSPTYFLLENVQMKKEWQDVISEQIGVEPILIDSALLSAQSRKRLYWTNIKGVEQPEDKGLLLKDVIESGEVDRDKSYCIDANYYKGGNLKSYFCKKRRQLVFEQKYQSQRRMMVKDTDKSMRILTPFECEKLQTLPCNYTQYGDFGPKGIKEISKTQRYKMLGNSFTCSVIEWILSFAEGLK